MSTHTCHAHGCAISVPPKMFMCRKHWLLLPKPIRDAIWAEYRPGQERSKTPSLRYLAVQQYAICRVAFRPNDEEAAAISFQYLESAFAWRAEAIAAGLGDPLANLVPEGSRS